MNASEREAQLLDALQRAEADKLAEAEGLREQLAAALQRVDDVAEQRDALKEAVKDMQVCACLCQYV